MSEKLNLSRAFQSKFMNWLMLSIKKNEQNKTNIYISLYLSAISMAWYFLVKPSKLEYMLDLMGCESSNLKDKMIEMSQKDLTKVFSKYNLKQDEYIYHLYFFNTFRTIFFDTHLDTLNWYLWQKSIDEKTPIEESISIFDDFSNFIHSYVFIDISKNGYVSKQSFLSNKAYQKDIMVFNDESATLSFVFFTKLIDSRQLFSFEKKLDVDIQSYEQDVYFKEYMDRYVGKDDLKKANLFIELSSGYIDKLFRGGHNKKNFPTFQKYQSDLVRVDDIKMLNLIYCFVQLVNGYCSVEDIYFSKEYQTSINASKMLNSDNNRILIGTLVGLSLFIFVMNKYGK